jgi:ribosome-associated protein
MFSSTSLTYPAIIARSALAYLRHSPAHSLAIAGIAWNALAFPGMRLGSQGFVHHLRAHKPEGTARYNTGMTRKTRIQPMEPAAENVVDENGYDRPSKSQLKREMHALQELGEALIALPKDALKRMPMPEKLDDAVREARRITDHEGKRRQLQYVGRVMRSLLDEETAALRTALDSYNGINKAETAKLHWIERTREKLLADDVALTEFIRQHPAADPQEGRTLIRNARKEAQQGKPPRYFRELFQWIKNADGPQASGGDDEHEAPEDDDDEDRA